MPEDKGYTEEQNKKLDKEITKTQDAGNSFQEPPIQIGAKSKDEAMSKETQVVKDLVDKFEKWDSWRKPLEDRWFEMYRAYFTNTIFSSESFFDVVPINPEDQDLAEVIQLILEYQLALANFYPKFVDFAKQLCIYGTSYFKVYWKVKRQWVWEREPIRKPVSLFGISFPTEKIVGWKEKKAYKVVERRPEVDVVDILDVYPDPDARTEQEGKGVFFKTFLSKDAVREMGAGKYPIYANTKSDALKSNRFDNSFGVSRQQRFTTRGLSNIAGDSKAVEILEFWGNYDIDGDGIAEEVYIVIGNRQVLLKATGNPFHHQKRPLVKSTLFPVPMEWYGIGLVEPVLGQQYELNTLRRQRLDNINQILNNMWIVKDTADIDLDTLITSPSGIILAGDPATDIIDKRPPDVTQSAYVEAQALETEMEKTTVSEAAQGTPASGRLGRTASGAKLIISQAMEKFGTVVRSVEETALKKVLRMFHQLDLQFIDDDDVLADPGLYGAILDEKVTPEMLRADVRFKMVGVSEMVNKEAKASQLTTFFGMFKDVMKPETITLIMRKMWQLAGFDSKELDKVQGAQPSNVRSAAVAGATDVAAAGEAAPQAAINEVQQNGSSVPPQALQ
jgi:hypothetical protein